jgi:glycosyltransferase involved in cell wall biosynthesis
VLGAALKSRKDAQASAELAAAMLALLQDPARREVLGRGGRSLVKRCFSLESMAGDLRVYRELLAEKRAASRVVSRG